MKITARACSNIALIKYWGKRDARLNLAAVGSISLTLNDLHTTTTVDFNGKYDHDRLFLNGRRSGPAETTRVAAFLDRIRRLAGIKKYALVESENNFPTAAGLASSASAFAALSLAASRAAGLELSEAELSVLARLGSGSAARSIFGGFVEMRLGIKDDGSDSFAFQLYPKDYWDLRLLIAVTSTGKKKIASTDGMTLSKETSPYYNQWIASSQSDLAEMRDALKSRDFQKLGELSESSCLKMHALAFSANPGLIYWNGATVEGIHQIRALRQQGTEVYFTIDAGPQLKAICLPDNVAEVRAALEQVPGVKNVISTALGDDAGILEETND